MPPSKRSPYDFLRREKWTRCYVVLLFATLVGLILRIRVLLGTAEEILANHGSDDLFYYTQIAFHWFQDGFPSIDGQNATTGFQPLFALLLMPLSGGFEGNTLFSLRVVLGLSSLLTLVVAWSCPGWMMRWLGQEWGKPAGALLGCFFLLHPRWLEVEFSGTESALAALAWLMSLRYWSTEFTQLRQYGSLGLILGLGTLARVDHVFLALVLTLVSFRPSTFPWLQRVARTFAGWCCVVLPWLAFCVWLTGSPLQDSGRAKRLQYQAVRQQTIALQQDAWPDRDPSYLNRRYGMVRMASLPQPLLRHHGKLQWIGLLGWVLLGVGLGVAWRRKKLPLQSIKPFCVLGLAVCLLLGTYGAMYGYLRAWYYVPAHLWLFGITATAWVGCWQFASRHPRWLLATAFGIWVTSWILAARQPVEFAWEPIYLRGGAYLQAQVPEGSRIGAFNAGIQSVVAGGERVLINLDGVVNHRAFLALRDRSLAAYLEHSRLEYLIDHRSALEFYDRLGGQGVRSSVEVVKVFDVPQRPGQELCLWRIQRDPKNQTEPGPDIR